ncbi:glutathione S-transferase 3-like [Discoglossus pictus]
MDKKPVLYYFNGRGRMESVRWLLAAAGVEFDEVFIETREQFEALCEGGRLLFEQVPLVEIDGLHLVQTRAILSYIAGKCNLYGKDIRERAYIDMYVEGTAEFMALILMCVFLPDTEKTKQIQLIKDKALKRYLPVYEKILKDHGQDYLVGNQFSWADIHLLEAILMVEEVHEDILCGFPQLQDFKRRISEKPTIKKFLEPGSQKKPMADENYKNTIKAILQIP